MRCTPFLAGFIAIAFDGREHGERHTAGAPTATEGWQISQKAFYWPLLVGTAHDIIATIEWARYMWPVRLLARLLGRRD